MHKTRPSFLKVCGISVGALFSLYIALIAVVMSYGSITIEFRQTIKQRESAVATLEQAYLARIQALTAITNTPTGYETPVARVYVNGASVTALR